VIYFLFVSLLYGKIGTRERYLLYHKISIERSELADRRGLGLVDTFPRNMRMSLTF